MKDRLEQLLSQLGAMGYVREEILALLGLDPGKPMTPEEVERAIARLERQVEFAGKCLAAVVERREDRPSG
ncbi:MAG: hypothetical protein H5T99_08735 [Moorella sp. (in: Bacteria)]|nr:hypothetical protein [Moorella sp. (in: firmicutes)]